MFIKALASADLRHLYRIDHSDHYGYDGYTYSYWRRHQWHSLVIYAHGAPDIQTVHYSTGITAGWRQPVEYVQGYDFFHVRNLGLFRFYWQRLETPERSSLLLLLTALLN